MKNLLASNYKRGSGHYVRLEKKPIRRVWGLKISSWIAILAVLSVMATASYFGYQDRQHQPGHYISPCPYNGCATWSTPPVSKHFEDHRAQKLYNFLYQHNSPLADFADEFVHAADVNGIDYTLSASISCHESSCGKQLANSYNAWGITTGLGTGPRFRAFNSWKEAIDFHAKFLAKEYRSDMIGGIQNRYCPASDHCSRQWTVSITAFAKEIAGI